MQSETSQPQKINKHFMIPGAIKFTETGKRVGVGSWVRKLKQIYVSMDTEALFRRLKTLWGWAVVFTQCHALSTTILDT